jgi:hypothetical protein
MHGCCAGQDKAAKARVKELALQRAVQRAEADLEKAAAALDAAAAPSPPKGRGCKRPGRPSPAKVRGGVRDTWIDSILL